MLLTLPHTPKGHYRLAVGSFFFLQGLVFASWASRIPDVKQRLDLNDAQLGGALFAIPVGQMLAMALSGYLVSRFGSRKTLTVAALAYPGALIAVGLASSMSRLFLCLVLFGMTANLSNISVNTQAVGVERLYRHSIMASFHGLWSFAGFAGGLVSACAAGFQIAPLPHFCFIFLAGLAILLVMIRSTLPRDAFPGRIPDRRAGPRGKGKRLRPDRVILLLGLIAFGNMACEGAMYDWSAVYFQSVVQTPPALVRLGYIAFMCAMVCGRFSADRFVTAYGPAAVLRASGLLIASGLLLSILLPNVTFSTLGFILVGFGTASVVPICYSQAGRSANMPPGAAIASVSTIGFLGFLICPPAVGLIAQAFSLRWSFAALVLLGLLTAGLASRLRAARGTARANEL